MRKPNLKQNNIDKAIESVKTRLIECALKAEYDGAKKELELVLGLLKLQNLKPENPSSSLAARRLERDKLMAQLNQKLRSVADNRAELE